MVKTRKTPMRTTMQKDIERTKKFLDEQPKVSFMLPLAEGEKVGASETVCINGYHITIKKGEMVEIPKEVARILSESYNIQTTAGSEILISRDKETKEALEG